MTRAAFGLSRALSTALLGAALLLGCSQILGLKEDVAPGGCSSADDCAPGQLCVADHCEQASDVGGSGGTRTDDPADEPNGGDEPGTSGSSTGGTSVSEGGDGGTRSGGGNSGSGGTQNDAGQSSGGTQSMPECESPEDCPGVDGDCSERTCDAGKCGIHYVKQGTALANQVAGDCQKATCDGKGGVLSATDDTDVPNSGNPCIVDGCDAGVPTHASEPSTKACGNNSQFKCDGKGVCGGCTKASDCGLDTLCATFACQTNTCKVTFVPAGQGNLANTAGDCKKNVCDGMGNPVGVVDNTDLPEDNNVCTKDICTTGTPSHSPEPTTKACGNFSACNGANQCVCSDPASAACPRVGAQCGNVTNGCGVVIACPNTCSGFNTCNGAGNPNKCGCTPKPLVCGSGQCGGTVNDGCGNFKDCTGDCQTLCPDNCMSKQCIGNGCVCSDCNG